MDVSGGSDSSDYSPSEAELMEYDSAQMATELGAGAEQEQDPREHPQSCHPPHHLLLSWLACSHHRRAAAQTLLSCFPSRVAN